MQEPVISPTNPDDEYFFDEGCFILESWNSEADPEVSIVRARLEPGRVTAWHHLVDTNERYVIVSGQAEAEVGDLPPSPVGPGDIVFIPAGCRQRIRNTGKEDLVFLAICNPRFKPDCYRPG